MFASSTGPRSAARRRGIVLVLVLGMLGLMALIGVTFATFAGQSLKNGRNFSQGVARPQAEALMDYALAQLINDTNNPLSAIRGHSLLRDMYGNDSVFRGSNPPANSIVETGGLLSIVYDSTIPGNTSLHFTGVGTHSTSPATPFYNQLQYATNIPTTGQYQGYDFTRWIIRFPNNNRDAGAVPQTFEVLEDDFSTGYHRFTLSANLGNPTTDQTYLYKYVGSATTPLSSADRTAFNWRDPNIGATITGSAVGKGFSFLATEFNTVGSTSGTLNGSSSPPVVSDPFVLDGRYMRAFNGPGLTRPATPALDASSNPYNAYPYNIAAYGNMRLANAFASINPDAAGMDEDYDACDLENWFMGLQSADGQVMIPSFHRPGILMASDWSATATLAQRAKILRPRQVDNSPLFPTDPSVVDANGKLTFDIDNDGDGVTDSVWLDLGYPVQRDPNGKLYKPLFAFMVLGLNGRLPLNTVGNLQARAIGTSNATITAAGETPDTVSYPNSSGQVPYAGYYTYNSGTSPKHHPLLSSQVYFDSPLFDHTSHLGYSVNEINPKFALQNAPSNLYASSNGYGITASGGFTDTANPVSYSQLDDAGVSVALTQLRNILAGTTPTDIANPYTGALPLNANPSSSTVFDMNIVYVNGQPYVLPNTVADFSDYSQNVNGINLVTLGNKPVPGRWGEPEGIPGTLVYPDVARSFLDSSFPFLHYENPVRAGRSIFTGPGNVRDAKDDDFDGFDPYLQPNPADFAQTFHLIKDASTPPVDPMNPQYSVPLNTTSASYVTPTPFSRIYPEFVDTFDSAGQMAVASERARRYVTPQDPVGIGRVVDFMMMSTTPTTAPRRPSTDYDFGRGADMLGRASYFRYFRPAGMPQEVRYPYADAAGAGATDFNYPYLTNSGTGQRYLMPFLVPAGYSSDGGTAPVSTDDRSNNVLHGYQSMATPEVQSPVDAPTIAAMGAMPYDGDPKIGTFNSPNGYSYPITLYSPVIRPVPGILSNVNSESGPLLNPSVVPYGTSVVNGYLDGGLNNDEADEMNLYTTNSHDMPYGPTDLEWLYRKHDVDGSSLNSRLSQLAPISFLNPADGLFRRRMFSTDAWDLINFSYANDNPIPYAGTLGGLGVHSTDHDFTYNSRFGSNASPSLEIMNQLVATNTASPYTFSGSFANPITTEFLPNPTLPIHTGNGDNFGSYVPNSAYTNTAAIALPKLLDPTAMTNLFATNAVPNAQVNTYTNVIIPSGDTVYGNPASAAQIQTPTVAHRDRKININYPLPISNDPAEPIRQKWCRETYQMLKAILPPASVDTPEELAALSQFVVNIIDFRDTDCTMTRFVNTDLEVTDVLTKSATNEQKDPFDLTWTVSPAGVRFSTTPLPTPGNHFPYDPSLYSPDMFPPTPYLVQHGMEYNPIALNEVMAYQAEYGASATATTPTPYHAMFVELINTLTEAQNNNNSTSNSSAISIAGWDIVIAPDNYGWGRPDPISGDLNQVILPPYSPNPGGNASLPPDPTQRQHASAIDTNLQNLQKAVAQFSITNTVSNPILSAINGSTYNPFIIGDYRTGVNTSPVSVTDPTTIEGTNAVALSNQINLRLPLSFIIPVAPTNKGLNYWIYLRRPANPFDVDMPSQVRPNKEMVVVDAMRFPIISASGAVITQIPNMPPTVVKSTNAIYSAQRLQPYRGGHLVRVDTDPTIPTAYTPVTAVPTSGPAMGVTKISPPSPPYAYGYSEQTAQPTAGKGYGAIPYTTTDSSGKSTTSYVALTQTIQQSINNPNPILDTWSNFPFHDRDFANVAELLLVPGCPPGLFTKQFVEEPYPGNVFQDTTTPHTTTATGTDNRDFATDAPAAAATAAITAPVGTLNPSLVGRQNFNAATLPAVPTFPYLTDNFYYTAASVAAPTPGTGVTIDPMYTHLTTEIGGWTGAGWHKMLEFFEVPSSANGAISTADRGSNYDWYRSDIKPGQLNLNLIIDEEVFAGLIDDPRINENLALSTSALPYIVSQIDANGYPVHDTTTGNVLGRYPIFPNSLVSVNLGGGAAGGGVAYTFPYGRGYTFRDPEVAHYPTTIPPSYGYVQVHGLKAAFSDFLKLRHGGSGYLFAHGGGDVSMGDYTPSIATGVTTQPVAADRPYRSLSYPDINYTIMRPASLPPAPASSAGVFVSPGTVPPLPTGLGNLFTYSPTTGVPYVQFTQLLAPMNETSGKYQYVQDPGIKNPYLSVQYVNQSTPTAAEPTAEPYPRQRRLAPPYPTIDGPPPTTPVKPIAAPFPPPIPPTPARRFFQIPDYSAISNANYTGAFDAATYAAHPEMGFPVNVPVSTPSLSAGVNLGLPNPPTPPSLVVESRAVFDADNYTPQSGAALSGRQASNFLGEGVSGSAAATDDYRQHPVYRTEWLQKISNLTTVRTHQFATWITVGFFEVVRTGTPELGIPDVLGQELGSSAGKNTRFRSFFVIDRTKATGFNPYYPGNFRDCVTYRRRIE